MDGIDFQTASPPDASHPARADIALFVGFVGRRHVEGRAPDEDDEAFLQRLPSWLRTWYHDAGWIPGRDGRTAAQLVDLLDVPVPLTTWNTFDSLFQWDRRPLDGQGRICDTGLGAAVRRFFTQGGRKCYVVRVGDPWPVLTPWLERADQGRLVLAGAGSGFDLPSPVDRSTWHGAAHLFGLPDVSFLAAPDLPELFAMDVGPVPPDVPGPFEEQFIECSARTGPAESRSLRRYPSPRCDADGFAVWAGMVSQIGEFVRRYSREVQFIAAVPLPADESALAAKPAVLALERAVRRAATRAEVFSAQRAQWREAGSIQSAFVQLAYPWLRTRESSRLPGDLEPPDAFLAGILAHNALTSGTWHSASRVFVPQLAATFPVLARSDLDRELPFQGIEGGRRQPLSLRQRISVFVPTSRGHQLLSDVTTDDDEAYRPANLNRLVAAIVRAARTVGEDAVFDNSGEHLWKRLRASLEGLLLNLWSEGALSGASPAEAFEVRCDRSTMTQNDIDAGRVITRVQFTASAPIERITVVLALDEGGTVSLISARDDFAPAEEAA